MACSTPEKLPQPAGIRIPASRRFNTIELNGSFSIPRSDQGASSNGTNKRQSTSSFLSKAPATPTHMLRLRNIEGALANFLFAQGVLAALDAKLGPILWQLPPNFNFEPERLEDFFALLPKTRKQAADLAPRNHDERLKNNSWFDVSQDATLRHAIEIRHESFVDEKFIRLLRRYDIGFW